MVRRIKASMEDKQYMDTSLGQCTQATLTADDVLDLLKTIAELKGLTISYDIEPQGNLVFTIGNCGYVMVGKAKA